VPHHEIVCSSERRGKGERTGRLIPIAVKGGRGWEISEARDDTHQKKKFSTPYPGGVWGMGYEIQAPAVRKANGKPR